MVFKTLRRVFGVLLFVLAFILKACVFSGAFHHMGRLAAHSTTTANGAYTAPSRADYSNAAPIMATDTSNWVMFNDTDSQSGQLVRHSRLTAPSTVITDGHPGPPNVLELIEQGRNDHHIMLTLRAPAICPALTSVNATFGSGPPAPLAVKPVTGKAGCTVEFLDYATVLQRLRDADLFTVGAPGGPETRFGVTGLSWD